VLDGRLQVELQTLTPNFKRFETRLNEGEWQPAEASFPWPLRPGTNRLAARTLNHFGITGPVSAAECEVRQKP